MIAETIKMPEPIIDPATSIVESSNPSPWMNLFLSDSVDCAMSVREVGRVNQQSPRRRNAKRQRSRPEGRVLFSARGLQSFPFLEKWRGAHRRGRRAFNRIFPSVRRGHSRRSSSTRRSR